MADEGGERGERGERDEAEEKKEASEGVRRSHAELAAQLGVDEVVADVSWCGYCKTAYTYSLEGDPLHWLGCSLYISCRSMGYSSEETSLDELEGNRVSLTKVVRMCKMGIKEFFEKLQKWMDMTLVLDDFRQKIGRMERNFSVSVLLFRKFKFLFPKIFLSIDSEAAKSQRMSKKSKVVSCNINSFYEFCWCLFICARGEFPDQSDNLVYMFIVLLSLMDYMFANAYAGLHKDLLNPEFEGLPSNWTNLKLRSKEAPCIVDVLCKEFQGVKENIATKSFKTYTWKLVIKKFFEKKYLSGDFETYTGILDLQNFETNLRMINKVYSTQMLKVGDLDERMFIGNISSEIGINVQNEEISRDLMEFGNEINIVPETPLSARKFLGKRSEFLTPISTATQSIAKLYNYLDGSTNSPSKSLIELFMMCRENPHEKIGVHQKMMAYNFLTNYAPLTSDTIAGDRLNYIEVLYYKLMEQMIKLELKKKPHIDLQSLLNNEIFHQTLFACCAEIVIHVFNQHNTRFPWILECLKIDAFYFQKIIESVVLVIREKLTRDVVKHLNSVEEQILETLAWTHYSPLWEKIDNLPTPVPHWVDVCVQDNTVVNNNIEIQTQPRASTAVQQSPVYVSGPSECFLSPQTETIMIRPGQSLLNQIATPSVSVTNPSASQSKKNNLRKSSVALFFRKFYSLASMRMQFLCTQLKLEGQEFKQKIWTCFENTVIEQTHLFKDRHLDQILMCTIYVICKISQMDRKFSDIMRCYRQQPRASNHVYRSVLKSSYINNENESNIVNQDVEDNNREGEKDNNRIDLITFYNNVYVRCIQDYTKKIQQGDEPQLSPLPFVRAHIANGTGVLHKISDHCNVFVQSLNANNINAKNQLSFRFGRNESKDFRNINMLLCKESNQTRKRPNNYEGADQKKTKTDIRTGETANTNSL